MSGGGGRRVAVIGSRTTGAAPRTRSGLRLVASRSGRRGRDGRREDVERDAGIAAIVVDRRVGVHVAARTALAGLETRLAVAAVILGTRFALGTRLAILARFTGFARLARFPLTGLTWFAGFASLALLTWFAGFALLARFAGLAARTFLTILAARAAVAGILVGRGLVAIGDLIVLALVIVAIFVVAARTLVLEAGAGFAQDAGIMFGELEIIFALDTIALKLGIARQLLILLEKLGGIATLAIVLPVAAGSGVRRAAPAAAATPAAALTIIDQMQILAKKSVY